MNQMQVAFLRLFGLKAKHHQCNARNYVIFHFDLKRVYKVGPSGLVPAPCPYTRPILLFSEKNPSPNGSNEFKRRKRDSPLYRSRDNFGNENGFLTEQKKARIHCGLSEERWLNLTYANSKESESPLCRGQQYRDHHRRPSRQ